MLSRIIGLVFILGFLGAQLTAAQEAPKRNGRPEQSENTQPRRAETDKQPIATAQFSYEFKQPQFVISHILIEHDQSGRGKISFQQRSEETPIVDPIELSTAAMARIFGLWADLRFLDSDENYQAPKNFAHLGTYWLRMDDGKRKRTAEFNWSNNKAAWDLTAEYRRVADQAILIFNLKLARELQPLNAPQLLREMETLLTRNGLSDPQQLVPLLTELRVDEHIPLIARNHADRILKKIEKGP